MPPLTSIACNDYQVVIIRKDFDVQKRLGRLKVSMNVVNSLTHHPCVPDMHLYKELYPNMAHQQPLPTHSTPTLALHYGDACQSHEVQ